MINHPEIRLANLLTIFNAVLPLYQKRDDAPSQVNVKIIVVADAQTRERHARKILDRYFRQISFRTDLLQKAELIALTIQDLAQIHLYYLNNLKTLFLMANLLFYHNGLEPFYPLHWNIFDGYSTPKMVTHLINGQDLFRLFFINFPNLIDRLDDFYYFFIIEEIRDQLNQLKIFYLEDKLILGHFNPILEEALKNPNAASLTRLLLEHHQILKLEI